MADVRQLGWDRMTDQRIIKGRPFGVGSGTKVVAIRGLNKNHNRESMRSPLSGRPQAACKAILIACSTGEYAASLRSRRKGSASVSGGCARKRGREPRCG